MSDWSSLEVVKLIVGVLTPVAVGVGGYYISRALKRVEHAQWTNQKVVERRLALYDEMATDLNRLMCFHRLLGDFRATTPRDVIEMKRRLDRAFYVNRFLMGTRFQDAYRAFIGSCFEEFSGSARDALIRADPVRQRAERGPSAWNDDWIPLFVGEPDKRTEPGLVERRYDELMTVFASELITRPIA